MDKILGLFHDVRENPRIAEILVAAGGPYADTTPGFQVFDGLLQIAAKPMYHLLRLYKHFKSLKFNTPEKHAAYFNVSSIVDRLKGHAQKALVLKKTVDDFKTSVTLQGRIDGLEVRVLHSFPDTKGGANDVSFCDSRDWISCPSALC